jgi:7-cyano-7-deazaguanine synthase in queuosine biosynthesis/Fe-S-cluster containining protein
LIDSLLGPEDNPKSAFHDLKKIEGVRFDGSKCATCPTNCCVVHNDEQYIAIREDELEVIYRAFPDAPAVRVNVKGKDGRRYYTVTKKGARCAFLGEDLRCTVYSARPRYCRENPGNAYHLSGWDGLAYDLKRCPGTTYEKPVLCLNSGGLDSLVVQAHFKAQGFTPYSLFIDYGQPDHDGELAAAQSIASYYGGKFYREELKLELWKELPLFRATPLRNLIFFSIAASYCDTLNIPCIGLAWNGKSEKYVLPKKFEIISPLLGKSKSQIARMGKKYGAPFELCVAKSGSAVSRAAGSISGS